MADGIATKKDPKKWSECKSRAKASMGGKHSARAMQKATQCYKKAGGKYEGEKPSAKSNKLKKWGKEDWGTKSGKNSTEGKEATGEVYLPKKAREALSDSEMSRANAKKRAARRKGKQYAKQSDDIAKKTAKYRS
tara:strand:+ start:122 stop:526 length:405 start_codon:yes stop_codon:yes gene_type:complete